MFHLILKHLCEHNFTFNIFKKNLVIRKLIKFFKVLHEEK